MGEDELRKELDKIREELRRVTLERDRLLRENESLRSLADRFYRATGDYVPEHDPYDR